MVGYQSRLHWSVAKSAVVAASPKDPDRLNSLLNSWIRSPAAQASGYVVVQLAGDPASSSPVLQSASGPQWKQPLRELPIRDIETRTYVGA